MRKRVITNITSPPLTLSDTRVGYLLAIIPALALGSGMLRHGATLAPHGIMVAIMLTIATGRYAWLFYKLPPGGGTSRDAEREGALLLVVIAWTIFRLGEPLLPNLIVVPALTMAWISIRYSGVVTLLCVAGAVAIELLFTLTGHQTLFLAATNLLLCGLVATCLNFFPGSGSYKTGRRQARLAAARDDATREQAAAMGLAPDHLAAQEFLRDPVDSESSQTFRQQTVANVNQSFALQLEMVRLALDLTTLAVLWPDQRNQELRLRYLATTRKDIDPGPYPLGTGITGALAGNREETELIGVKPSHPALPYYRQPAGVGSIMALRIAPAPPNGAAGAAGQSGILCADRETAVAWTDRERQILRLTGSKLALEISGSRLLLNLDRDRATIHRLCRSLRTLNSDPDLDAILATSVKAVKEQVPTDLLALCLREGEQHRIVLAEGAGAEKLTDRSFPVAEGLVGQALKTATTLPAGGRYLGGAPIFANARTFSDYRSILVIPLPDEKNLPIGCLVVAAHAPRVFTRNRQEILEIIAAQIAIKIKLGQTHARLALLATTDGLTGLANHRAFQHGCAVMLERAERNGQPLCLLLGDLDHFKRINDSCGHPCGDQVLQKVATVLAETVRVVDLAARYGGEEFALVLENCDEKGGRLMAERIREKVALLKLRGGDRPLAVTLSIGGAVFPKNCGEQRGLIDMADQALYRAKQEGRNRTVLWSDRPAC
jgi:diguanylate cyclase (GGDEF)-like protein